MVIKLPDKQEVISGFKSKNRNKRKIKSSSFLNSNLDEMKTIAILGTVHVFDVRRKIRDFVVERKPDAVCVELDEERYDYLMKSQVPSTSTVQEDIARFRGAHAGDDMRGAIEGAKEIDAELVMMDKDWREINSELLRGGVMDFLTPSIWIRRVCELPFIAVAGLEAFGRVMSVWLTRDDFDPLWIIIKAMEEEPKLWRYMQQWASPNFKKALLDDREEYMAQRIKQCAEQHDAIIAVTGLLHMKALQKKLSREGLRLQVQSISMLDL